MADTTRERGKVNVWGVLAAIITIAYSLPILWLVMTSFKSRIDIFAVPPKFIFRPTLTNYIYTINRGLFWGPLLNSVIMSVVSVLLAVALTIFAAYAISRFNVKGSQLIMFMVLSLRMMPAAVVVIPMFLLYRLLGLVNNYIGMILLYAMFSIPFSLWMLKGFIDEVPRQFDDAALADGASVLQVLRDVILPQLGPAIATVIIFNMIFVWNEFLFSYILTGVETRTIPVQIALGIYTDKGVDWEYVSALSTIYIVPIVIAVFALQKSLLRGMTFGTIRR
ncbi:MAG TPA: carbohydrate ABC transporter permease [Firmicutes bacterium]|nr:carbohydrate ABC transporter permease [Bacillota bacterium]